MAEGHYHLHAEPLQRSKGHSSLAAAAYRAGQMLHDERTGKTHDYRHRGGVIHSEMILPADAPDWAQDRETFWNRAEAMERRQDAQVARMLDLALPHELSDEDRIELVRCYVRSTFVRFGMAADVAWHAPHRDGDARNFHAHVMLTLRKLGPEGFDRVKTREWNSTEILKVWRARFAEQQNRFLAERGFTTRVDHRSFKERGIDREPTLKIGRKRLAMARKGIEPAAPVAAYSDAEMKFIRDYHLADAAKQRWLRHPKSRHAKERRAVLYKQKEHGDRLYENFRRAKGNYRRVMDENERLRGEVAAARNEAFALSRAQRRADERVQHVFAAAFVDGAAACAKFAELARRKGVLVAAEEAMRRPQTFGRLKGFDLFGKPNAQRQEGQKMLRYLGEQAMTAAALEEQRGKADNWLTQLQNRLQLKTGRERLEYQDWAWTLRRHIELNDRKRDWQALKEEKTLLRLEQEREIALLRAREDARIQNLDASGRFEEANARRTNQALHGILLPPSDESAKRARQEMNRQRLLWARRADREREEWRRSRTRSSEDQALADSHYVVARESPWFFDEDGP